MNANLLKKISWKAWACLRVAGILLVLGGGASLLHAELSEGEALERQLREKSDEAQTRIDQGIRARQFHDLEEPLIDEIEKKLTESVPNDSNGFTAFLLAEKDKESLDIKSFDYKKSPKNEEKTGIREVPFVCQGRGSYGGILRFVDRVYTHRGLVSVDRFAIARSSVFHQYLGSGRGYKAAVAEEEFPPESHSFILEGRVAVQPGQEAEEK